MCSWNLRYAVRFRSRVSCFPLLNMVIDQISIHYAQGLTKMSIINLVVKESLERGVFMAYRYFPWCLSLRR